MNCILKLIKKQKLLRKYKKGKKEYSNLMWLLNNWKWDKETKHFFNHEFLCELRCYNRIKNLK